MASRHYVYTNEKIILIDPYDHKIGEIEKILGHEYGMLHRAFSVVLFRKKNGKIECLLQQRAKSKYHGGGLWTNACCSHQHTDETDEPSMTLMAETRLKEEMGLDVKLKKVKETFHYIAKFENGLTENELTHVFIGVYDGDNVPFNPDEVENYQWVEVENLYDELDKNPKKFTPWFKQALTVALSSLDSILKK